MEISNYISIQKEQCKKNKRKYKDMAEHAHSDLSLAQTGFERRMAQSRINLLDELVELNQKYLSHIGVDFKAIVLK